MSWSQSALAFFVSPTPPADHTVVDWHEDGTCLRLLNSAWNATDDGGNNIAKKIRHHLSYVQINNVHVNVNTIHR